MYHPTMGCWLSRDPIDDQASLVQIPSPYLNRRLPHSDLDFQPIVASILDGRIKYLMPRDRERLELFVLSWAKGIEHQNLRLEQQEIQLKLYVFAGNKPINLNDFLGLFVCGQCEHLCLFVPVMCYTCARTVDACAPCCGCPFQYFLIDGKYHGLWFFNIIPCTVMRA